MNKQKFDDRLGDGWRLILRLFFIKKSILLWIFMLTLSTYVSGVFFPIATQITFDKIQNKTFNSTSILLFGLAGLMSPTAETG